jgi:hypothetical protein
MRMSAANVTLTLLIDNLNKTFIQGGAVHKHCKAKKGGKGFAFVLQKEQSVKALPRRWRHGQ